MIDSPGWHQKLPHCRGHRFDAIRDPRTYQQSVPLSDPEGLAVAVQRIAAGEQGVLTREPVQLLEPTGPDTPVGRFLDRRGEGVHHVGYGVADITAALESIGAAGVRLIDERPRHGSMGAAIAFLHPADIGGVLTELVQAAGTGVQQ